MLKIIIPLFRKKKVKKPAKSSFVVQTRHREKYGLASNFGYNLEANSNNHIYRKIRNYIPIVDAAFEKIEKITGSFKFKCKEKKAETFLNNFAETVKVGNSMIGLNSFLQVYLDSLLMYGNAVGEIVLNKNYNIKALYNANIDDVLFSLRKDGLTVDVCAKSETGTPVKIKNNDLP